MHRPKSKSIAALTAALAFACAAESRAALVTFSTPTRLIDDGTNLQNGGTTLAAINFSTGPVRSAPYTAANPDPNVTLNGIAFTPTVGNVAADATYFTSNAAVTDNARQSGVASTANIYGLIYDTSTTSANGVDYVITLRNLIVGQEYRFQTVFSMSDAARAMTVVSGGSSSAAFTYGTTNGPQLLAGTFVADAATQAFTYDAPTGAGARGSIAGVVLQAIPEPGSAALAGVGLLVAGARRRRRAAPSV